MVSSYNVLQRVSIGLDLVTTNLQANSEMYALKKGNFWKLSSELSVHALESSYDAVISLKGEEFARNLSTLQRNIVESRTACIRSEAIRDMRDWVILRDAMDVLDLIHSLLL